jgi:hypothetical protein
MEIASQTLFTVGVIVLTFAFAATIGHAVFLANGRRLAGALAAGAAGVVRPAWAGVATGSFVDTRSATAAAGPADFAAPSPLSSAARWLTIGAFAALAGIDDHPRRPGRSWAVGQPVRVLRRVRDVDPVRVPGALAPLPDPVDRLHPRGVSLLLALYASSLPREISQLVPALQNPPLLTIHVGLAMLSYGVFATSFAAGVAVPGPGQGRPLFVAALAPRPGFRGVPRRDHRLPDLRHDDHPGLVVGVDRLVPLLGLGPEGDLRAGHVAHLRHLPPRPQPARVGRTPSALLLVIGFVMILVTLSGSLWFNGLHAYSGL